jgi:outer membrane autotransporter protein
MAQLDIGKVTIGDAKLIPYELSRLPAGVHNYNEDTTGFPGWPGEAGGEEDRNPLCSLSTGEETEIEIFEDGLINNLSETLGADVAAYLEVRRLEELPVEERDILDYLFAGEAVEDEVLDKWVKLWDEEMPDEYRTPGPEPEPEPVIEPEPGLEPELEPMVESEPTVEPEPEPESAVESEPKSPESGTEGENATGPGGESNSGGSEGESGVDPSDKNKDDIEKILNSLPNIPPKQKDNMFEFFKGLNDRDFGFGEDADRTKIKSIYAQHNPDFHVSSQVRATILFLQNSLDALADRMASGDSAISSPSPRAELLLAAVLPGAVRGVRRTGVSRSALWTRVFGNMGSQKLEENMKSGGFGVVLGVDSRLRDDIQLGLAYSFSSDSSKSDLRDKQISINALSLYGDYGFRNRLHFSAVLGGGLTDSKDNKLSGKGSLIHFSPTLGYQFNLRRSRQLSLELSPEFSLRYFRVHQDRQNTEYTEVAPLTGNVLTLVPAIRLGGLFRDRFEFGARLGLGYDVLSSGVNSYSITLPGGDSYRIEDESGNTRFVVEFGLNVGCRLNRVSRVSLGYGGKYAEDLVDNNLSLGVGFKF